MTATVVFPPNRPPNKTLSLSSTVPASSATVQKVQVRSDFFLNKRALLLAGKGSYSNRSKHLSIRFMGLRNLIGDEKIVIVHISIKDQLSVIYLLRSYF